MHHLHSVYVLMYDISPSCADGLSDDKVVERINTVVKLKKKALGGFGSPEALYEVDVEVEDV